MVPVVIFSRIVIVIIIDCVRTCRRIVRVCNSYSTAEIIVVPRVGRFCIESEWPEKYFVHVVHSILIIVNIDIVTSTVVIMVVWSCNRNLSLHKVRDAVAIKVIVCPVYNSIIVMVERMLFFSRETTRL